MFNEIKKIRSTCKMLVLCSYLITLHVTAQTIGNDLPTPTAGNVCPELFYQLTLSGDARLCHLFADQLPASLSYHSDQSPIQTEAFFRAQITNPVKVSKVKDRTLIEYENHHKIIVISKDGKGSQIDILVTSN
ncbi:MAG: hypothetical protein ACI9C4_000615 [Paraglaciecola sp.]|jgi:hypothetical protein